MKLVKNILASKGSEIWHTTSDDSVLNAIKMMAEKGVGALLVMDNGRLVGIMSERDYARKVILQGKSSRETPVSEIMTIGVEVVDPIDTVERCMELMTDKRIRHLPVVENDSVIGVLSIGDLVKAIIEEQQFQIEQLESYIAS
ncbi:MAG: CBS domain-containing protein [Pyrinomonadaceae bacterium]|nr:CBS domain-containing protein [Pyrinomonadaceae bacterium]